MRSFNRRDAVKLAAGLTLGVSVLAADEALGQETKKPAKDPQLETALASPYQFVFGEQVSFKTSTTEPHTFDLVITSARDPVGTNNEGITVRPGTMRIFRADADRDEFTKKGGMYWRCGDTKGKVQFKEAGPLVMVVREHDGAVRCYTLALDYRC